MLLVAAFLSGATYCTQAQSQDGVMKELDLVKITGGTYLMGSPVDELWRSADEAQQEVRVADFYLAPTELSQALFEQAAGYNPSFFKGTALPVESVSFRDALEVCNALSRNAGLKEVYRFEEGAALWDLSADGYRLPTEQEWEYACRAGSTAPFNVPDSPDPQSCNYYGHYPYNIEAHYFNSGELKVQPGEYRNRTVEVDSFAPNAFGLWNMHGNVAEWVISRDPSSAEAALRQIYRGGGYNDFAKNLRSAYRGVAPAGYRAASVGLRVARSAVPAQGQLRIPLPETALAPQGKVLVVYYSWSGNTKLIADKIAKATGADLLELKLKTPYSQSYSKVLDEAQQALFRQDRPTLVGLPAKLDNYQTIIVGYPLWWASIPMPVASFAEHYDLSGKYLLAFCSNGGGHLGQSVSELLKLLPQTKAGQPFEIYYRGDETLPERLAGWLDSQGLAAKP